VIASIPDTGAASPYNDYKRNIGRYMLHFVDPARFGTMPTNKVARVVFKAGTDARPRTRYYVGFWAKFGPIGRFLAGDRFTDMWMSREIPHRPR
jgi:hypothetical protein